MMSHLITRLITLRRRQRSRGTWSKVESELERTAKKSKRPLQWPRRAGWEIKIKIKIRFLPWTYFPRLKNLTFESKLPVPVNHLLCSSNKSNNNKVSIKKWEKNSALPYFVSLLARILFSSTCGLALSWMAWHETSTSGSGEGNWRFSPSISHQRQTLSTHSAGLMHHSPARTLYLSSLQTRWIENCSIAKYPSLVIFSQKQISGVRERKMSSLIMDKLWQHPFYSPWVFLSTVLPRLVFNHLIVHVFLCSHTWLWNNFR